MNLENLIFYKPKATSLRNILTWCKKEILIHWWMEDDEIKSTWV